MDMAGGSHGIQTTLALMLLLANLANTKWCKNPKKMTETLAHGYSSESTQWELSNGYQHDRVEKVFINLCVLVLRIKVASALEGLDKDLTSMTETLALGTHLRVLNGSYPMDTNMTGLRKFS